jgi:uncharacterized membrane protein
MLGNHEEMTMTKQMKAILVTLTLATGAFGSVALYAQSGGMMGGGMMGGGMMGNGSGDGAPGGMMGGGTGGSAPGGMMEGNPMMAMMNMMAQMGPMMEQCNRMMQEHAGGHGTPAPAPGSTQ